MQEPRWSSTRSVLVSHQLLFLELFSLHKQIIGISQSLIYGKTQW